jgi:hypothetical protein
VDAADHHIGGLHGESLVRATVFVVLARVAVAPDRTAGLDEVDWRHVVDPVELVDAGAHAVRTVEAVEGPGEEPVEFPQVVCCSQAVVVGLDCFEVLGQFHPTEVQGVRSLLWADRLEGERLAGEEQILDLAFHSGAALEAIQDVL